MLKRKRADASIIILVLIIIFFLAVSFLIVNYVGIKFIWIMENTALNDSSASATITDGMKTITTNTIDNGFLLMFTFLVIGIIISGFLVRIHVIWLFLYIIMLGVGIYLAIFLGNAYQHLTETRVLAEAIVNMPKTIWIMQHSVKIILAVGALSMIVIFSKIFKPGGYEERM